MHPESQTTRIDRWLWAVRLYKTRSLATKACVAGHVQIRGENAKPSRSIRIGDIVEARIGFTHRKLRVRALLDRRVGPKLVALHVEDLTSPEELARAQQEALSHRPLVPQTFSRPTKRQRRKLERWWGSQD